MVDKTLLLLSFKLDVLPSMRSSSSEVKMTALQGITKFFIKNENHIFKKITQKLVFDTLYYHVLPFFTIILFKQFL